MSPRSWVRCGVLYAVLVGGVTVSTLVRAQEVDNAGSAAPFGAPVGDDRVYWHGLLDELEGRYLGGPDSAFRWDGEAWAGTDTNRVWLKSEGFAVNGTVQDGDHELLYSRPISPYFDLQAGVRYDLDSLASRGWAAFGVEGLAAYFFQLSATVYASDAGHFAAKVLASYDEYLTQRLVLEPLVELNAYTRSDPARDVASGLSDLDAGLRLRYEVSRKFAPYLGVVYERVYGPALRGIPGLAGMSGVAGMPGAPIVPGALIGPGVFDTGRAGDWRLVAGVRVWL